MDGETIKVFSGKLEDLPEPIREMIEKAMFDKFMATVPPVWAGVWVGTDNRLHFTDGCWADRYEAIEQLAEAAGNHPQTVVNICSPYSIGDDVGGILLPRIEHEPDSVVMSEAGRVAKWSHALAEPFVQAHVEKMKKEVGGGENKK